MFANQTSFARFTPFVRSAGSAMDRDSTKTQAVRIGPDGSWLGPRSAGPSVHALLVDGLLDTEAAAPTS